jgi:hypothetical protein
VTLTNTGSTPTIFAGVVSKSAVVPGTARLTVTACSVPWNQLLGTCSQGATVLTANTALSPPPVVHLGPAAGVAVPAGHQQHLQVYVASLAFSGWLALTVPAATLPVGGRDRTHA